MGNDQNQMIQRLNSECFCISLDQQALRYALASETRTPDLFELLQERCPTIFAAQPVFVSPAHMARMQELIAAIESVIALPAYREEIDAQAPAKSRHASGARGVFMGYDFHVAQDSFGLIEINTNAGGAMLNALMARAQRACCPEVAGLIPPPALADQFETDIVAMFQREWALAGKKSRLATIAIVDADPQSQYLYPEFLLFKHLFERNGIKTVITDPGELELRAGQLWHAGLPIDLVYNRLTDFLLESPSHAHLREAYLSDAALLTPDPQAHALYADKRNLILLSDEEHLKRLGVPEQTRKILLAGIPHTQHVHRDKEDLLWAQRKQLFFKPAAGYGSRAAYRGDKLTRRVWEEILAGDYVAQALITPGERMLSDSESQQTLKFDLRNYVYAGQVQWVAARLYQGQTTNFRTPGGGFAPVYPGPESGGEFG
ncbi:hypothetical protein [Halopseudomonas salina]|uniref:Circularly permuted type 2 ATP-grasp protein n=1 Tax=Halopseudomonas salina TaxID=1323744 RepID=A0ABQ1Q4X9_9GAMM|nr:hypothetical protein [Halopseudomonas salina]GGD12405.1 hypothetical protein GCM10007418_34190 [Halopseudomonas salina]